MSPKTVTCARCGTAILCPTCGASIEFPEAYVSNYDKIQEAKIWVDRGFKYGPVKRDWQRGIQLFNRAIELDPENALAWKGKAHFLVESVGGQEKIAEPENARVAEEAVRCLEKAWNELADMEARSDLIELNKRLGKKEGSQ